MAGRLLRALSPFRRKSSSPATASQKAQEAKDEDARNKARLLKSKEEEEQQALLLRIKEEDERRFHALRRKDEEERRMQLFAGRGKDAAKGSAEEGDGKEEELHSARALQGKREGEPRGENGGLRQENGTGRFRYENGFAEKANGKESQGNVSPISPLAIAASSSSSSSPSLHEHKASGTHSPFSDHAASPQVGKVKLPEGNFTSPLSGNPLLPTLSGLSQGPGTPEGGAAKPSPKRSLSRPLNISFARTYDRERAEAEEQKGGGKLKVAASPTKGSAEQEARAEPPKETPVNKLTPVGEAVMTKKPNLEVEVPEDVPEPAGPTVHSPFRLTTSPIYMPPEAKPPRASVPPAEAEGANDDIPWAKDSNRRGLMIEDESTFSLPRINVRVASAEGGEGHQGGGGSPRFASPGVSPRFPSGSRSPRHAAPTKVVRRVSPQRQPPKMRAPGSFAAPLVRKERPGGGDKGGQRFMRGTASSLVKTAGTKEGGMKSRGQSAPRKRVSAPAEAKKQAHDDVFAGDKLLDFGASTDSFAETDRRLRTDHLSSFRRGGAPGRGSRGGGRAGGAQSRMHRSASFPVDGATPAELTELAALKAQLASSLHTSVRMPSKKEAASEALLKSPVASGLKSSGGLLPLDLKGGDAVVGENEPPAVPADVPLAAEAVFEAPVKTPKSPLKSLLESAFAPPAKGPVKKPGVSTPVTDKVTAHPPKRSSSPLRKSASPKTASPKGPVPVKEEPSPSSARGTLVQTGPPSPGSRSTGVRKPPTPPARGKPALEVDVPPRTPPSGVTSLLASPNRGSPRNSPSFGGSPASSPSRSPLRSWRSGPPGGSSLMSPTAASMGRASASPRGRSPSPTSRLARTRSAVESPSPGQRTPVRTNSLPSKLEAVKSLVKGKRASSPTPPVRSVSDPLRSKSRPGVSKKEPVKKMGLERAPGGVASAGFNEDLIDLEESSSLVPSDVAASESTTSETTGRDEDESQFREGGRAADNTLEIDGEKDQLSAAEQESGEAEVKAAVNGAVKAAVKAVEEVQDSASEGDARKEGEDSETVDTEAEGSVVVESSLDVAALSEAATRKSQETGRGAPSELGAAQTAGLEQAHVSETGSPNLGPAPEQAAPSKESGGKESTLARTDGVSDVVSDRVSDAQRARAEEEEKERRRAEVASLLAAVKEREEIEYIARLVRRAQREQAQAQTPETPGPEDPPSVTSSIDSLASIGPVVEKVPEVSGWERIMRTAPLEEEERAGGLLGWSRILGASEVGGEAVWADKGLEVSGEGERTEAPLGMPTEVETSGGVRKEVTLEPLEGGSRGSGGLRIQSMEGKEEEEPKAIQSDAVVSLSAAEPSSSGAGQVEGGASVQAEEPKMREGSASISMPEKLARGALENPETGDWDPKLSPTSPLEFMDDGTILQQGANSVPARMGSKLTPQEKERIVAGLHADRRIPQTPKPDLHDPATYIETALVRAGLAAPEPQTLPEWYSQTEVLDPALFQELERQVDADLLPTPGGGHRKDARWRLSLDSTALRDAYSRLHTPRKEGYAERRILFDCMEETLAALLAPYKFPPLGKRRLRPLRKGPRGRQLVAEVVARCQERRGPGFRGLEVCSPQGVEELLQRCLPQAQRKWDNFEAEEAEVEIEIEVGILDDLIGEAVQGFVAMERQRGGKRRIHPMAI